MKDFEGYSDRQVFILKTMRKMKWNRSQFAKNVGASKRTVDGWLSSEKRTIPESRWNLIKMIGNANDKI